MKKTPEFLVEGILPANEVHLICGVSGAGKTTWTFQEFLAPYLKGQEVFGHQSHLVSTTYIALDRTSASVARTLDRLSLKAEITQIICLGDVVKAIPDKKKRSLEAILQMALTKFPDTKLFVVEGFALMAGALTKDYATVGWLMQDASVYCEKHSVTIIGICHAPKLKKDEKFQHSRENVLGSMSWAAYGETIIVLDLDEKLNQVSVKVLPRNAAAESQDYNFGPNGTLIAVNTLKPKEAIKTKIESLAFGEAVKRSEIRVWADALGASDSTADRVIKECLSNHVLDTLEVGVYERSARLPLKIVADFEVSGEL